MRRTALIYDSQFLKHDTGPNHPERSDRLIAIMERLDADGILDDCTRPPPQPAPADLVAQVHAQAYISHIAAQSAKGRHFFEGLDTIGNSETYDAALMAVGAVTQAVDSVMAGDAENAFCAVRPPGHHAENDEAMGFCFFNNIAIGAKYLQQQYGIKKVAIADWDVHHGNGTQHTFYSDPSVLYFSCHQYPHYPGTGQRDETGKGDGKGTTVNVPLAAGCTDTDYLEAIRSKLRPAIDKFKPEFMLISAGFDAHVRDPLSGMQVSSSGFAEMTAELMGMADQHCGGRLVSVLEGGYDLAGLADAVTAHVRALVTTER